MAFRFFVVLLVCVVVATMARWVLPSAKPTSLDRPLPSPNGHDAFVAAGESVVGAALDMKTASLGQMREHVSSNTAALAQLRLGLSQEARAPIEFAIDSVDRRLSELSSIKRLAGVLRAEAKVLEADQRIDDALSSGLDALRFSHESVRGGLLIDLLVGVACEAMALASLESLLDDLNAAQCQRAIQVIEGLERAREPASEFFSREAVWCRRVWGWRAALVNLMPGQAQSRRQAEQKAVAKRDQTDRQRGALLVKLAWRAYALQVGKAPGGWADLVPRHLGKVPADPSTGEPLPFDVGAAGSR